MLETRSKLVNFSLFFTIAYRNIVQARRRSLLLGSAIAFVTFVHIGLQSVSNGYMQGMVNGATAIAAGHVNVVGLYKYRPSAMFPVLNQSQSIMDVIDDYPEVKWVSGRVAMGGKLVGHRSSTFMMLQGIEMAKEVRLQKALRLIDSLDGETDLTALLKGSGLLLAQSQAEELELSVGDFVNFDAGTLFGSNVVTLQVVGIYQDIGLMTRMFAFTTNDVVRNVLQVGDDIGGRILIYLDDREKAADFMRRLRDDLASRGFQFTEYQPSSLIMRWDDLERGDWTGQRLDMTTWRDNMSEVRMVIRAIDGISAILLVVLSVIVVIGIFNTIWISARERANEIGCIRAIGMSSRQVLGIFMLEALLIGLFGAAAGGILGYSVVQLITLIEIPINNEAMRLILFANTVNLAISWLDIVLAVLGFALVTGLAAFLPSLSAARIQPIQAINKV